MIYYITKARSKDRHAGGKAPNDIDTLCLERGWKRLVYPSISVKQHKILRIVRAIAIELFWLITAIAIKRDAIVVYQHPMRCGAKIANRYIKQLKNRKNVKFIALIHDLDSIRYTEVNEGIRYEDEILLKQFNVLICHNSHMENYLAGSGVSKDKIVCLQIFDYLVKCEDVATPIDGLAIAGNLSKDKCKYIYDLALLSSNVKIYAYGVNFEENNHASNLIYQGSYQPDELPPVIQGKFGIIWDGDSIETCSGNFGEYMRYNNPHKLSLYLAAGKPVICWKQSAIADFVTDNEVGLAVESLTDALDQVRTMSESAYNEMRRHVMTVRSNVVSGFYFYRAVDEAIKIIENESSPK